ncbi:hypothetical protein [Halogeometricum rufum]|uniref:hypothetical protein n=1 Tax=Halogeometricum rufum TaxID=553469 RepID=UPI000B7F2F3F|nr:hypothetical protein [Halogeometricum rufum]
MTTPERRRNATPSPSVESEARKASKVARPQSEPARAAVPATRSQTLRGLCFLPPGFGTDGGDDGDAHGRDADGSAAVAARTHPSVAERLSNLRAVAASLEGR